MAAEKGKGKVIILGGGTGSLTAALELTNQPDWKDRFEKITVYQLGWRLGGKGASGRGENGRIEEHGLHIWLGFYENAFRVIQQAYRELDRPPDAPLATWEKAFKKHSYIVIEENVDGEWKNWPFDFPTDDADPGGGADEPATPVKHLASHGAIKRDAIPGVHGELPTLWEYLTLLLGWMKIYYLNSSHGSRQQSGDGSPDRRPGCLGRLLRRVETDLESAALATSAELIHEAHALAHRLAGDPNEHDPEHHDKLAELLDSFTDRLWKEIEHKVEAHDESRRLFILMDLGAACVRGLLKDRVLYHEDGLDALDGDDFRGWLKDNGAAEISYNSAVVRALYDLVFAYHNGEVDRPSFAAGVAIRSLFRMGLTYRGAIFWKMQAGMGDTIFTPLYQVLKNRGVEFKFFHRVKNLALSADEKRLAAINIGRQVTVKDGEYDPLVPVQDLPCWPSTPLYDQILEREQMVDGKVIKLKDVNLESFWTPWQDVEDITIEIGPDDVVILGISLGSLPYICSKLIDASDEWKSMVRRVETVRTMAVQLWLNRDMNQLGWDLKRPVTDAYVEPLNTWADMSHLIDREDWPARFDVEDIAYFCGPMVGGIPPLSDEGAPAEAAKEVKDAALAWLEQNVRHLWPLATKPDDPEGLNWNLLVDPENMDGTERFNSQYWRANIDPSERYILSVAGSTRYRLKTDESGFENLYLVGDWINNGFNAGCVEAAVMSGMQASNAIAGYPKREEIIGDSHP